MKFLPLSGQTGLFGNVQKNSRRDKRDRANLKFFRTGQTGFGTIKKNSGRDIRDSGHKKVCPGGPELPPFNVQKAENDRNSTAKKQKKAEGVF